MTPSRESYTFTLAETAKLPPDWVCLTSDCNEALPAKLFETRTESQPRCPRCDASMCRSPYARVVPRQRDGSDRHLSATQIEVLRAVRAERPWLGIGDGKGRTCRSLMRRGLIMRRESSEGGLLYVITSTGLAGLERCR